MYYRETLPPLYWHMHSCSFDLGSSLLVVCVRTAPSIIDQKNIKKDQEHLSLVYTYVADTFEMVADRKNKVSRRLLCLYFRRTVAAYVINGVAPTAFF